MPLELHPSRVFAQLMIIVHLLSLGVLWLIHGDLLLKLVLFGGILLSTLHTRRLMRTQPRLTLLSNREIVLHHNTEERTGILTHDTLVTPFLVLLRFRLTEQHRLHSIPVFYDALPREQFRALRIQLKLNRHEHSHLRRG